MKKLFTHIRLNGKTPALNGRQTRELIYANMIWLSTFFAFFVYCICVPLLNINRSPAFMYCAGFWIVTHFCFYFIIRLKLLTAGKYWLIVTTYLMVATFDLYMGLKGSNYLYLFAFLPTALTIFSVLKNKITVAIFVLLPLVYMITSRSLELSFPFGEGAALNQVSLKKLSLLNFTLGFLLFALYAGYMILNNMAKQQRLLTQGISLQATLDNSSTSIWSIDTKYILTAVNSKYIQSIKDEFTQHPLKVGMNLRTHPVWEKIPVVFKNQYEIVLSGKEILEETELNNRIYEVKAVPIYDLKRNIQGATFGSRDITVPKRAAEMLLKAKKQAEEAYNAKARFISNMSHEIRTPLNGIIGVARILQDEGHLPSQLSHLKTLEDLSEHTVQIVNNILDFAKIDAGKAALENNRFNIARFTEKIKSIFAGTAQLKGLKFNIETNYGADVFVRGDEVRLSQVLINLLGNSFKFTESGSVTLKVNVTEHPEKRHYLASFSVIDTGIGIKPEHTSKIFDSFTQAETNTTRRFGGTGLGLSIAYKIVSLMGGKLQVQSEPGIQTTFSFSVKFHMSSAIHEQPLFTVLPEAGNMPSLNILLAEDNKVNQLVAVKMLQKWKHKITIANNGQEAVNYITENNFDVVLMDLDMPVMDGYDATEAIKQHNPHLPVIALTAASFEDMHNFLAKKGFSTVVQKPFVPGDLIKKIISLTSVNQTAQEALN